MSYPEDWPTQEVLDHMSRDRHMEAPIMDASNPNEYNGWKNYPTWAVNMWLSNDEGLYETVREMVAEMTAETESTSKYWTLEESHKYNVADMLKDWVCNDLAPDLGATFAADLLGYALGEVDWNEISAAWLEDASE